MLHNPLFTGLRSFLSVLLILGSGGELRSQTPDGSVLQEKAGVALVKPQPWSKENEATVYEFQGFFDRSSGGAGYYEFHKGADKRQVPISRIVKIVIYPDSAKIKDVLTPADRLKIETGINDLKSLRAKFPATSTYIDPFIQKLNDELVQYDSGKVKINGAWISKQSYDTEKAANLITLLKADVAHADPPSSFEFATDPKVVALKEVATRNPQIKQSFDEVSANYFSLLRKEKRAKILVRLAEPTMPMAEAQTAIGQLKALEPAEDAKSVAFLKAWESGQAIVTTANAQATTLGPLLEKELSDAPITDAPPQLSDDLTKKIIALNDTMRQFVASRPPPQLIAAANPALAIGAIGVGLPKLQALFTAKQFLDAKEVADDLARQAHQVGPATVRIVAGLQSYTAKKTKEYNSLREEAKLLSDAKKPADALLKYQAAYEIIPDSGLNDIINHLKQTPPPPAKK